MQVLESGLKSNCTSGSCGAQPFDVEAGRMLAQLYLEDRMDPKRGEALLRQIHGNRKEPHWIDQYLETLVARNREENGLEDMVSDLVEGLPQEDPRHRLVKNAFGTLSDSASEPTHAQ